MALAMLTVINLNGSHGRKPSSAAAEHADAVDAPYILVAHNHQALQRRLASLSSRSTQIVAAGSGHVVMRDRPESIVEAVRAIVGSIQAEPGA